MSCIIGLKNGKNIFIGADGFATDGDDRRPIIANKIFRNGDFLIGFAGSVRGGRLLDKHLFKPPKEIWKLPDSIQKVFERKGCITQNDSCGLLHPCNFLIAHKGKLYEILSDFQLNEVDGNFTAIGAGSSYAMGALLILEKLELKPEEKIMKALEASAFFSTSVGPPFVVEKF